MASAVMCDHAVALLEEEGHLGVPVIAGEGPAVVKYDGLTGAPVFVIEFCSVFKFESAHF